MLGLGLWRVESERGGDQRSELLDVGAHHDDVARLKCGIVSEQADEHLPQHLHLTIGAVAGVELHASVGSARAPALVLRERLRGSQPCRPAANRARMSASWIHWARSADLWHSDWSR